jgi:hypothetical protein
MAPHGAETCVRIGACTRSQRCRRDSLCPRGVAVRRLSAPAGWLLWWTTSSPARSQADESLHAVGAARRPGRRLLLVGSAAVLGASGRLQAAWRSTLSKRAGRLDATAAWPGGATLWRDAGSREVRLPTRADRCIAGWIHQSGARGENAGGSPIHHSGCVRRWRLLTAVNSPWRWFR